MKHLLVATLLLASAGLATAAPQRFPISLRGTVDRPAGKQAVTDQDWVSVPGNRLVLLVDTEKNIAAIEEWNADLTTQVDRDPVLAGKQALLENFRMAFVPGARTFMANLEMVDRDWDNDGTDDHDGNMQLIAKLSLDKTTGAITRLKAQLIGVFNDPVNGAPDGEAALFRGTISSTGSAF